MATPGKRRVRRAPIRETYGQWKIDDDRPLGRGGNGEIWRVRNESGLVGALKLLKEGKNAADKKYRLGRFKQEIQFLLDHPSFPGILPLLESRISEGASQASWYIMPVAIPLRDKVGRDPDIDQVIEAFLEFSKTLSRLADEAVAHRDIKPDNLFYSDHNWVLGDFGLVAYPENTPLTKHGRRLGPIDYMAPEMRESPDTAEGEFADVYSLAKSLWVLIADENIPLPGPHRSDDEVCSLANRVAYKWVNEIDLLIERCTAHDPLRRPRMSEVCEELMMMTQEPPELLPTPDTDALKRRIAALVAPDVKRNEFNQLTMARFSEVSNLVINDLIQCIANDFIPLLNGFNSTHSDYLRPHNLLSNDGDIVSSVSQGWSFTPPRDQAPILVVSVCAALRDYSTSDCGVAATIDIVGLHSDSSGTRGQMELFESVIAGIAGSAALNSKIDQLKREMLAEVPHVLACLVDLLARS